MDFWAYFGPFSLVNRDQQKMADFIMKMASNQKMQENKLTLKFNFTIEKRWGVSKFSFWHSNWALISILLLLIITRRQVVGTLGQCGQPAAMLHYSDRWIHTISFSLKIFYYFKFVPYEPSLQYYQNERWIHTLSFSLKIFYYFKFVS